MRTSRKRGSWTLQLVDDVRVAKSVLEINDLTALILANGMSGKGLNWNHRQNRIRARIGGLFIIAVAVIVVGVVISAKVRYLVELEPPEQYNRPYDGPIDERVMSVSEVRKLCTSLGASARGVDICRTRGQLKRKAASWQRPRSFRDQMWAKSRFRRTGSRQRSADEPEWDQHRILSASP